MSLQSVRPCRRQGGFTLIEALVVLAIAAIVMGAAAPAINRAIQRNQTESAVREAASLMQRMRLEAIRSNRAGVVRMDTANRQLVGFIDVDGDLTFNPDPAATARTADYEVARFTLPKNLDFRDEASNTGTASVDRLTAVGGDPWAIFQADGSIADLGAFRFADPRGNVLEVRVDPPATARIQVLKYDSLSGTYEIAGDPASPTYRPWEWK